MRPRAALKGAYIYVHRHQIINYKSLLLYTYEMSVDKEPRFNETIEQNTKKML